MVLRMLQRAHCETDQGLIHFRKDGAMALGTQCRELIASEVWTA